LEALSGEGLDEDKASKVTGKKVQSAAVKAALSVVKVAQGTGALNQRAQALASVRAAAAATAATMAGPSKPGLSETEG
jgi:hypothetical protein